MQNTPYTSILSIKETEIAIKLLKDFFQMNLATTLNLTRVSAPLFVHRSSGLNDMLSGNEVPVFFKAPHVENNYLEIVHSLAKWKRLALHDYGFIMGEGIYTDMNAIRREEVLDATHSLYVDQWDWERILDRSQRNSEYLHQTVRLIYNSLRETQDYIIEFFPELGEAFLPEDIFFIHSQALADMYPDLDEDAREQAITKEHGAVFIQGIGGKLSSGAPHGMRSPDYDDWDLNGDIIIWNPTLNSAVELSSMGIRVDATSMMDQLTTANSLERLAFPYHQKVVDDILPLTIGGGIGQSRICMLLLHKIHIGEVQSSVWDEQTIQWAADTGVILL